MIHQPKHEVQKNKIHTKKKDTTFLHSTKYVTHMSQNSQNCKPLKTKEGLRRSCSQEDLKQDNY